MVISFDNRRKIKDDAFNNKEEINLNAWILEDLPMMMEHIRSFGFECYLKGKGDGTVVLVLEKDLPTEKNI